MNKAEKKDEIIGWLLALALAALLTWYVIHPVPRPNHQRKLDDYLPEADWYQKRKRLGETARRFGRRSALRPMAILSSTGDEDLPDWPNYIELD